MKLLDSFKASSLGQMFLGTPGPMDDFWYSEISRPTASGVRVDGNNFLNYSVCWAATRLLAGTSGWLPFNLYRSLPGGGAEIAATHPVHRLIHDEPNACMGSMMFRSRGVNHQVNQGNCYAEIIRTAGGVPVSLEPISPSRIPSKNIVKENGRLVYYVDPPPGEHGTPQRIEAENMFHVPSIVSEDGICGKGVVAAAREAIGKAIGTQGYGASSLANGGVPPFAVKGGKFRNEEARREWRRQYMQEHAGATKAGRPLLLPQEAEVQVLGFSLQDTQFIESQQFDIEEIARWYGVPPHLVGHLLRATFNNIEELGISFVKYSLMPWLKLWESEVYRKLLTRAEKQSYYAKFVVDALERGSLHSRTEALSTQFFHGALDLDTWASIEDRNPIGGELGRMRFVQSSMIPLDAAARMAKESEPAEEPAMPDVSETAPVAESEMPVESNEEAAAARDVQATALNGAQIAEMRNIALAMANAELPKEATRALLTAGYPLVDPLLIKTIVDDIEADHQRKREEDAQREAEPEPEMPESEESQAKNESPEPPPSLTSTLQESLGTVTVSEAEEEEVGQREFWQWLALLGLLILLIEWPASRARCRNHSCRRIRWR